MYGCSKQLSSALIAYTYWSKLLFMWFYLEYLLKQGNVNNPIFHPSQEQHSLNYQASHGELPMRNLGVFKIGYWV